MLSWVSFNDKLINKRKEENIRKGKGKGKYMNHLEYSEENLALVISLFKLYGKLFTHIRKDYLRKCLLDGKCIYEEQVLIIYTIYKRDNRIGNYIAKKGSITINQIVTGNQGNGSAARVIRKFLSLHPNVCLSVRQDNERAVAFYRKVHLQQSGTTSWKDGTIPGLVFSSPPSSALASSPCN